MTYRSHEPLYIIVVRGPDAERHLRDWARDHGVPAHVENNRIRLFEMHHLNSFEMTWTHDWAQVSIWDCWNRRHLSRD